MPHQAITYRPTDRPTSPASPTTSSREPSMGRSNLEHIPPLPVFPSLSSLPPSCISKFLVPRCIPLGRDSKRGDDPPYSAALHPMPQCSNLVTWPLPLPDHLPKSRTPTRTGGTARDEGETCRCHVSRSSRHSFGLDIRIRIRDADGATISGDQRLANSSQRPTLRCTPLAAIL